MEQVKITAIVAQAGVIRRDGLQFSAAALREVAANYPEKFSYDEETGNLMALIDTSQGEISFGDITLRLLSMQP